MTENPFAKGRLNVDLKKARSVTECSNLMAQFGYQDGMVVSGLEAADLKISSNRARKEQKCAHTWGPGEGGGGGGGARSEEIESGIV